MELIAHTSGAAAAAGAGGVVPPAASGAFRGGSPGEAVFAPVPTGAVATESKVLSTFSVHILPVPSGPTGVEGMLSMRPAVAERVVLTEPGTRSM